MQEIKRSADVVLAEAIGEFAYDPYGYVMFNWPWGVKGGPLEHESGPRAWQAEVLKSIGARLLSGALTTTQAIQEAIASGHGIGKSALVAWIIKWSLDTSFKSRITVTAGTDGQLKTKTFPEITKWHNMSMTVKWFTATKSALYSSNPACEQEWRCDATPWSEHNPDAFAGLHNKGRRAVVVFDEASSIADIIWETIEGAMTDSDTELIWVAFGNPVRPTGRFRQCFTKFRHRWRTQQIDSRTVDGVDNAQIEKWAEDYGEDSDFFKVRVRGVFPTGGVSTFISPDLVEAAMARTCHHNDSPLVVGLDIARKGDDATVFYFRRGRDGKSLKPIVFRGLDTCQCAEAVIDILNRFSPQALFLDNGNTGAGVFDMLVRLGYKRRVYPVDFGGKVKAKDRYANKRVEMWGDMKEWLEVGSIVDKRELEDDLIGPECDYFKDTGKIILESKKDMKKRGLPSPDHADALALTFAEPVAPEGFQGRKIRVKRSSRR